MIAARIYALSLLLIAAGVAAGESSPVPVAVATCPAARTEIRIDGKMDEAAWEHATAATHFAIFNSTKLASPQSIARFCHDEAHLYVHVTFPEPAMDKLVARARNRDGVVWFDDSVEVFIDPRHDHRHYFQFVVNSLSTGFDRSAEFEGWNGQWEAKARVGKTSWSIEMAFPFATLGIERPEPGQIIGFNVCRERYAGQRQLSSWSPVRGSFHDCPNFGHLVFAGAGDLLPGGSWLGDLAAEGRPVEVWTPIGLVHHRSLAGLLAHGRGATIAAVRQAVNDIERLLGETKKPGLGKRLVEMRRYLAEVEGVCARLERITPKQYLELHERLIQLHSRAMDLSWDVKFAELFGD